MLCKDCFIEWWKTGKRLDRAIKWNFFHWEIIAGKRNVWGEWDFQIYSGIHFYRFDFATYLFLLKHFESEATSFLNASKTEWLLRYFAQLRMRNVCSETNLKIWNRIRKRLNSRSLVRTINNWKHFSMNTNCFPVIQFRRESRWVSMIAVYIRPYFPLHTLAEACLGIKRIFIWNRIWIHPFLNHGQLSCCRRQLLSVSIHMNWGLVSMLSLLYWVRQSGGWMNDSMARMKFSICHEQGRFFTLQRE